MRSRSDSTAEIPDHVAAGWLASGDSQWREPRDRWRRAADGARIRYAEWHGAERWERDATSARYRQALAHEEQEADYYAKAWYAAINS